MVNDKSSLISKIFCPAADSPGSWRENPLATDLKGRRTTNRCLWAAVPQTHPMFFAWSQNYAPVGGIGTSALIAAIPVVLLLGLLAFWHVRAHIAAIIALIVAIGIAVFVYGMPTQLALAAAAYGAAFGFLPIGWLIINAIFIYQLSVDTGQFKVLQKQIAGVSGDRRIQALLLAFSFGAFIEGAAGFGAPVAISGALMIGLGFRPLEAAKLALIGNTAPVAFGSL